MFDKCTLWRFCIKVLSNIVAEAESNGLYRTPLFCAIDFSSCQIFTMGLKVSLLNTGYPDQSLKFLMAQSKNDIDLVSELSKHLMLMYLMRVVYENGIELKYLYIYFL